MRDSLRLQSYKITRLQNRRHRQRGYMMITLMLAVALITIGLLAVLPAMKQQAQRDREEELRHRGTAYMRAIQHFYKKFGRYPTRVEELESTNNLKFLRKRYTDPMSRDAKGKEKDFKFLHQQDIALNSGPVLNLTPGQPGQPGQGAAAAALGGALQGALSALGGQAGGLQQTGAAGQTSASGDSNSSSSGNSDASGNSNSSGSSSSNSNSGSSPGSGFNGPTFGGGPILGVASTNKKDKTVRVFAGKTHYNDWLFIYISQLDRGGLLVGPVDPNQPPTANLNGAGPTVGGMQLPPGGLGQGQLPSGLTQGFPQPQQNPTPTPPPQQ